VNSQNCEKAQKEGGLMARITALLVFAILGLGTGAVYAHVGANCDFDVTGSAFGTDNPVFCTFNEAGGQGDVYEITIHNDYLGGLRLGDPEGF
jgi:hypothetical protein